MIDQMVLDIFMNQSILFYFILLKANLSSINDFPLLDTFKERFPKTEDLNFTILLDVPIVKLHILIFKNIRN